MQSGWPGAVIAVSLALAACSVPAPLPSEAAGNPCGELPPRTSPTDFPVAVLHVAGDDLPPVVGEIEWLGGDEPLATAAARAIHLERFTVLQVSGASEMSLRMSDAVSIGEWQVDAIPNDAFRRGELDGGESWSTGSEPSDLVCVPIKDGAWLIRAELTFADGAGRGVYYWRLNVNEAPGA
ncbi:MAG: hypothetical protein M3153_03240 [Chloroflexota bacterium]|nr:hypothetical protein [Chloroflexota bacterium]